MAGVSLDRMIKEAQRQEALKDYSGNRFNEIIDEEASKK